MKIIKSFSDLEQQTILELRYLCFRTWEEISVEMGYSVQQIYRIRDKAFDRINLNFQKMIENDSKC